MGMQIVTAELKMGCALLVEVDETTLQDHAQGRTTVEENLRKNKNRPPPNGEARGGKPRKDSTHRNFLLPRKLPSEERALNYQNKRRRENVPLTSTKPPEKRTSI